MTTNSTLPAAVITGTASGLGRAIAQRFIRGGYRVAGLDIAAGEPLDGLVEIMTDITSPTEVARAFDEAQSLGTVEILVNAAGVYPRSTLSDASSALYRKIFDVNVLGTVLTTQCFAERHDRRNRGCVVNISSVDGIAPFSKSVLYSASKAAVINLTAGIADELAAKNIRVQGIAPAYIATDRVIALVGDTPADAASPAQVAETCWSLTRPGFAPLVTGQTVVARKGPLDA